MGSVKQMLSKLIQDSVLKICTQNIPFFKTLEVDGIICISAGGDDDDEIVVKMHRTIVKPKRKSALGGPQAVAATDVQTIVQSGRDKTTVSSSTTESFQPRISGISGCVQESDHDDDVDDDVDDEDDDDRLSSHSTTDDLVIAPLPQGDSFVMECSNVKLEPPDDTSPRPAKRSSSSPSHSPAPKRPTRDTTSHSSQYQEPSGASTSSDNTSRLWSIPIPDVRLSKTANKEQLKPGTNKLVRLLVDSMQLYAEAHRIPRPPSIMINNVAQEVVAKYPVLRNKIDAEHPFEHMMIADKIRKRIHNVSYLNKSKEKIEQSKQSE